MIDRSNQAVGLDSFRGVELGGSLLRSNLYGATGGSKTLSSSGLIRTESPLPSSGILVCNQSVASTIRDPISGSTLRFSGGSAVVVTPKAKQALMRNRRLTTAKDIDSTIQM